MSGIKPNFSRPIVPQPVAVRSIVSAAIDSSIDSAVDSETVNIGINSQVINIGTGTVPCMINIGGEGDVINIGGTTNRVNTTNVEVENKTITLNKGALGLRSFGMSRGAGIVIQDGFTSGHIVVSDTGDSFEIKAPESSYTLHTPHLTENETLTTSGFVNSQIHSLSGFSKSYTDTQVSSLTTYVDTRISSVSGSLRNYTDSKVTTVSGALASYIDTRITSVSGSLKGYVDNQVSNLSGTVKTYVDTHDLVVLNTAKSYTDSWITSVSGVSKAYTDAQIETMSGFVISKIGNISGVASTDYVNQQIANLSGEVFPFIISQIAGDNTLDKIYVDAVDASGRLYTDSKIQSVSGLLMTKFNTISGSLQTQVASVSGLLMTKFNTISGSLQTQVASVSGLLMTKFNTISGSLQTQVDTLSGSIQMQISSLSGFVETSVSGLVSQSFFNTQISTLSGWVLEQISGDNTLDRVYVDSQISTVSGVSALYVDSKFSTLSGSLQTQIGNISGTIAALPTFTQYPTFADFPENGVISNLYVDKSQNELYRYYESITPPSYDWSLGVGGDFETVSGLISSASVLNGHTVKVLSGTYMVTSTVNVNKQLKFYGEDVATTIFTTSGGTSDPVSMFNVSVDNVLFKGITFQHRKTSNTSIETAIVVSGPGFPQTQVANFILDGCIIENVEFGLTIRGNNWKIVNSTIAYTGPSNSTRRSIGIYGTSGECFVSNNVFSNNTATGALRVVCPTSTTGTNPNELYLGTLVVENNTTSGTVSQFYSHDAWQGISGGFTLVVKNNVVNENNAFVSFFGATAGFGEIIKEVVVSGNDFNNTHGGVPSGGKGAIGVDGNTTFRTTPLVVYHSENTVKNTTYRGGYTEVFSFIVGRSSGIPAFDVDASEDIPPTPLAPATPEVVGVNEAVYVKLTDSSISGILMSHIQSEISSISGFILSSLSGLISESYVQAQLSTLSGWVLSQISGDNTLDKDYVDSQIQSLSGSVFTMVQSAISGDNVLDRLYTDTAIADISGFVLTSLSGLASQSYVDGEVSSLSGSLQTQMTTLSGYVVSQLSSISGFATETFVTESVTNLSGFLQTQISSVSGSSKSYTDTQISRLPTFTQYTDYSSFPDTGVVSNLYIDNSFNELYRYYETVTPPVYNWKVGPTGDFADVSGLIASASVVNGDTVQIENGTYIVTATVNITKQLKFYGESLSGVVFTTSGGSSDPVSMFNVSVDNVSFKDITFQHRKTSNTSIETAIVVSGPGFPQTQVANFMIDNCIIENVEFALTIRGNNWKIVNSTIAYTGPNNSTRRGIGVYGTSGNCFINNNVFTNNAATGALRAIQLTSTTGTNPAEQYLGTLSVENNTTSGPLSQFYSQDSWQGVSGGFTLVVKNNVANENNAFVSFYGATAGFGEILNTITVADNTLTNWHNASGGKGVVGVDGTAPFRTTDLTVYNVNNTVANTIYRPGYSSILNYTVGKADAVAAFTVTDSSIIPDSLTPQSTPVVEGMASKVYTKLTDTSISGAAATYIDSQISTLSGFLVSQIASVSGASALYTDSSISTLSGSLQSQVSSLSGFVISQVSAISGGVSQSYVDSQIISVSGSSKAYTDAQIATVSSAWSTISGVPDIVYTSSGAIAINLLQNLLPVSGSMNIYGQYGTDGKTHIALIPDGSTSGMVSGLTFYGTPKGVSGTKPYRAVDIVGGFNSNNAYDAYLAFNTNTNGSPNLSGVALFERMRLTWEGRLGLGTTSPLTRLSINPLTNEAKITLYDGNDVNNHTGFGSYQDQMLSYHVRHFGRDHVFYAGGKVGPTPSGIELVRIKGTGNVGIAMATPSGRLHVAGGNMVLQTGDLVFNNLNTYAYCSSGNQSIVITGGGMFEVPDSKPGGGIVVRGGTATNNPGGLELYTTNANTTSYPSAALLINFSGHIGVGTDTPGFPLEVASSAVGSGGAYYSLTDGGVSSGPTSAQPVSIKASQYIWSNTGFVASSDARIKKDIRDISDNEALTDLLALQPKIYKYKDVVQKGETEVYGFIAQEVESVLPEAVTTQEECIPNIYKLVPGVLTTNVETIVDTGTPKENTTGMTEDELGVTDAFTTRAEPKTYNKYTYTLTITLSGHGLSEGVFLRVFDSDNKAFESAVRVVNVDTLEMTVENRPTIKDDKVFVYGSRVTDFKTLKKDYIYTLNVAATQELARKYDVMVDEYNQIHQDYTQMYTQVQALQAAVADLQAKVQ
jgi:hypothetical protein